MKKIVFGALVGLLPVVSFAQQQVTNLEDAVDFIYYLINLAFPVLIAIAVFVIVWGIFQFVLKAGDEEARKTGRSLILWGVIGIFLMLSVWGLVNIVKNTISFEDTPITDVDPLIQL
jgi:uncharacterized membrane protein HdeD (DUF308 family)